MSSRASRRAMFGADRRSLCLTYCGVVCFLRVSTMKTAGMVRRSCSARFRSRLRSWSRGCVTSSRRHLLIASFGARAYGVTEVHRAGALSPRALREDALRCLDHLPGKKRGIGRALDGGLFVASGRVISRACVSLTTRRRRYGSEAGHIDAFPRKRRKSNGRDFENVGSAEVARPMVIANGLPIKSRARADLLRLREALASHVRQGRLSQAWLRERPAFADASALTRPALSSLAMK